MSKILSICGIFSKIKINNRQFFALNSFYSTKSEKSNEEYFKSLVRKGTQSENNDSDEGNQVTNNVNEANTKTFDPNEPLQQSSRFIQQFKIKKIKKLEMQKLRESGFFKNFQVDPELETTKNKEPQESDPARRAIAETYNKRVSYRPDFKEYKQVDSTFRNRNANENNREMNDNNERYRNREMSASDNQRSYTPRDRYENQNDSNERYKNRDNHTPRDRYENQSDNYRNAEKPDYNNQEMRQMNNYGKHKESSRYQNREIVDGSETNEEGSGDNHREAFNKQNSSYRKREFNNEDNRMNSRNNYENRKMSYNSQETSQMNNYGKQYPGSDVTSRYQNRKMDENNERNEDPYDGKGVILNKEHPSYKKREFSKYTNRDNYQAQKTDYRNDQSSSYRNRKFSEDFRGNNDVFTKRREYERKDSNSFNSSREEPLVSEKNIERAYIRQKTQSKWSKVVENRKYDFNIENDEATGDQNLPAKVPNNELEVLKKNLTSIIKDYNEPEKMEDIIKELRPAHRPFVYNLAYFVNDSEVLKKFIEMGVKIKDWDEDRSICEYILKLDFNKDVSPYLIFLHDIGIKSNDYAAIIHKNPHLFKENLDDLQTRIEYLKSKKFTKENICDIVVGAPRWLNYSVEIIDRNLGWFQREFKLSGQELREVAVKKPKLIIFNLKLPSDMRFVLKEFLQYNDDQIKHMIRTNPKLFTKDYKSIEVNYNFLADVMSFSAAKIAEYTPILHMPFVKLRSRYSFLKKINRAQFDPTLPNFVSLRDLCTPEDSDFVTKIAKSTLDEYNKFLKSI